MSAADRHSDGYEPRFDIDAEYGMQAELFAVRLIDSLKNNTVEVKRDGKAADSFNVYVEFEHDPGRRGKFKPSGIDRPDGADLWLFVLSDPHLALVISRDLLRMLVNHPDIRVGNQTRGSCPTRGYLLPIRYLVQASLDFAKGHGR